MKKSIKEMYSESFTFQFLFSVFVVAFLTVGCGKPNGPSDPTIPPDEFSEHGRLWQYQEDASSSVDEKRIGAFFRKNPILSGSPEWTGQPLKYVCKDSKSLVRYYWFRGRGESLTWNVLETQGGRFRQLSGSGLPGSE